MFTCVCSIAIGTFSALYQKRIKRLFAYSTISHTGFILLGMAACTVESSKAVIIYLILYSALTILLFSLLIYSVITAKQFPIYMVSLKSLGINNYVFAITLTLTILSIAGIPPLAGFFSKLFVLLTAISNGHIVLATIIVLLSSVACFYYIRLVKIFFFSNSVKNSLWLSQPVRQNTENCIAMLSLFNLFFVIRPDLISHYATVVCFSII